MCIGSALFARRARAPCDDDAAVFKINTLCLGGDCIALIHTFGYIFLSLFLGVLGRSRNLCVRVFIETYGYETHTPDCTVVVCSLSLCVQWSFSKWAVVVDELFAISLLNLSKR